MSAAVAESVDDASTKPARSLRQRLEHPVVLAGLSLIALQLALRAWALYGSWFYADDYRLIADARSDGIAGLLRPLDSQLMPGGRLIALIVSKTGDVNWPAAATSSLVLQAIASAGALWCLLVWFGRRWLILVPLALFLTSGLTIAPLMWWAAALNQVPEQATFFLALGAWVRYLRGDGDRWLLGTGAAVVLGLAFYVKTLLLLPALVWIAVAYFSVGSPWKRIGTLARKRAIAVVMLCLIGAGYTAYYLATVPSILQRSGQNVGPLAHALLVRTLGPGLVGGPLRWENLSPPAGLADPPAWFVVVAWTAIVVTVGNLALRRTGVWRAMLLVLGYAAASTALLVATRAQTLGSIAGLEPRYLADVVAAATLSLGLASMSLVGATGAGASRERPTKCRRSTLLITAATVVTATLGTVSAVRYAGLWHNHNPSKTYAQAVQRELRQTGSVDLVDTTPPVGVLPPFDPRWNRLSRLTGLMGAAATYPETSADLLIFDDVGALRKAIIKPGVTAQPGPIAGCGWKIDGRTRTIVLTGRAFQSTWWVRIAYLSSASGRITVTSPGTAGAERDVLAGAHSLYTRIEGSFDRLTIGTPPGLTLCVSAIEVGQPEPGALR